MNIKFRKLKANEIDVRLGQAKYENPQDKKNSKILGASYLLYKDARVDMSMLDEVVGSMNWQRKHEFKDGKLYCSVGIFNDTTNQWVWKEDVGTESQTEAEKGQASDSFKRACFNWGIGRELYTSPFIWIKPFEDEDLRYTKLHVEKIGYDGDVINELVIKDSMGRVRYKLGSVEEKPEKEKLEDYLLQQAQELNIKLLDVATYLKKPLDELTNAELKMCIEKKRKAMNK